MGICRCDTEQAVRRGDVIVTVCFVYVLIEALSEVACSAGRGRSCVYVELWKRMRRVFTVYSGRGLRACVHV